MVSAFAADRRPAHGQRRWQRRSSTRCVSPGSSGLLRRSAEHPSSRVPPSPWRRKSTQRFGADTPTPQSAHSFAEPSRTVFDTSECSFRIDSGEAASLILRRDAMVRVQRLILGRSLILVDRLFPVVPDRLEPRFCPRGAPETNQRQE